MFAHRLPPRRQDQAIAVAGLLGGLLLIAFRVYNPGFPPWLPALTLVPMAALETVRRTRPVLVAALGGVLLVAALFSGALTATVIMYTDLLYAGTLYGSRRMPRVMQLLGAATTLALTCLTALTNTVAVALLVAIFATLLFLAPVWTADLVRKHRDRADSERLRAEQIELLAELDRRGAVVAERARMARELHDVVANHLSAIAIHATGAQSLARRQQRPEEDPLVAVLAVIRENSVQGLAEMRRMIGLLRAGDQEPENYQAPRLGALDSLLAQVRAAGRDAGLAFEAEQRGEPGELPAPVELAAYRIVQESLTNALKHAGRGTVRLCLQHGPEQVEITVDSPYRPDAGRALPGARAGLVGMGERAQLLGGSFRAGPRDGVWQVRAVLPVGAAAQSESGRA
ncbi:histidine kinase [Kitasatospora sp. NBC_01250]|uniref:sensor histidine kinase n=1 Tax=unclassified Kitasatospora TaxID=2633591 RepID=UPI002E102F09|nr:MULTISPECIES: histidine kinase [unclassified Kitasatospora]WSJ69293.1 histidine kinase [Kitasatospora sp. NBC_01302]